MDILSPKERSHRMSLVRSTGTKLERQIGSIVKQLGYKYRSHPKKLPGKPDFVFFDIKKVVFAHGCFWHQHGSCRNDQIPRIPKSRLGYWQKKLVGNKERDIRIRRKLSRMGWNSLVLWECQIRKKTKAKTLPARIKKFLKKDS